MRTPRHSLSILTLFIAAAAAAQPPTLTEPVQVLLDNTGVEYRFVNPVNPVPLDAQPLEFVNNTGDRTFTVTIPFVYTGPEVASAYAVAEVDRGKQVVSEIVCKALYGVDFEEDKSATCPPPDVERSIDINAVNTLEGLRTLYESVSAAKELSLEKDCQAPQEEEETKPQETDHLRNGSCAAEMLFWTATCKIPINQLVAFAESGQGEDIIRPYVVSQATQLLNALFIDKVEPPSWPLPLCGFATAKDRQMEVICKLESSPKSKECVTFELRKLWEDICKLDSSPRSKECVAFEQEQKDRLTTLCKAESAKSKRCIDFEARQEEGKQELQKATAARVPSQPIPPVDTFAAGAKNSGLKARFAAARVEMAKIAIQDAITIKMKDELKPRIKPVFTDLEAHRRDLARREDKAANAVDKAFYQCRLREVEAAAKLLASYGLDSSVPYRGVPESLTIQKKRCENLYVTMNAYELSAQMERVRSILGERTSEQGIEVTDCQVSGTTTSCSATATIPPYQSATFSSFLLRHSPEPRIQFAVSFFGDTEIPANPNGYVLRKGAGKTDKKPKSKFGVQLGGDTSTALDPDKFSTVPNQSGIINGQRRHSGASGTLAFQYSGPVEASVTVQYKKEDFGSVAPKPEPSSTQLQASQYQAKVYGPRGIVFQYGKIPFAQPSSGIAVNVTGEGMQVIAGPVILGYVVSRESASGIADRSNDDHDLWLFQAKNIPIKDVAFLRTFDFVAAYGNDRKDEPDQDPTTEPNIDIRPFTYTTFGTELRWGLRRVPALGGSFAAYHSVRNVRAAHGSPNPATVIDGRGTVGLARISWTHLVSSLTEGGSKVRPAFGISGFVGYGTGDDKKTPNVDEGYLGEKATYSNDVLFLSRVANSDLDTFSKELGKGLSNKRYVGLQYTDARASLLGWISSHILNAEEDIASRSTVLSLHAYRFGHEVRGGHWAGTEGDLEFKVEAPKNIQWSLGAAYYRRSPAIKLVGLKDDLWSVTAKLAIKLGPL